MDGEKTLDGLRTGFLLDGGNVVAEVQNNTVTQNYLRGINLIRREAGNSTEYYLFNAHGDVVNLVNTAGVVTQSYDYDAFGVEQAPDPLDTNHFRYCGEYLDAETGRYYLRARYYDPLIGRFTQRDTHWNTANMIYGDNPQKINEREDKLGLKTYSYAPQISAIVQSGNLYVYGINNPVKIIDHTGESGSLALQWTSTTWWLAAIDGPFIAGEIIYGVGIVVTSAIDLVSKVGVDNLARLISETPDAAKKIANDLSGGGGGSIPPGDPKWGKGFETFRQLKKYLGSAGKGNHWHHVVEQCQIQKSNFSATSIHNVNNIVNIPASIHNKITAYYNSVQTFTNGLRFRDWLAGQSFEVQYDWGIKILRMYGIEV